MIVESPDPPPLRDQMLRTDGRTVMRLGGAAYRARE